MSLEKIEFESEEGGAPLFKHLPAIVWQRKWWMIIPSIVISIAAIAAAFLLPTRYESSAVLLVESPQLPEEIAGAMTTDIVDQRIAKIRQQVLSRGALIEIIQKFDLYTQERTTQPLSEVILKMRESVKINAVNAELQQSGGGRSSTIAFSMAFEYSDATKAHAAAQELVDRILQLDSIKNAEQAADTVQFLTDQSSGLQTQIALLETQITGIKARNGGALSNQGVTVIGSGSGAIDAQIAALQRDNAQLNAQRDVSKTSANRDPVVSAAEAQLAAARSVYAETHPDVVIARQRLAEARELAKRNTANQPIDVIANQIAFNNSQISALQAARSREAMQSSAMLNAQARAPVVLEQVAQLQQKLDGLNVQYQDVSKRLMMANAGQKMETEQKGERLSLVDPPVVPDEPSWPDRPKLIVGGILGGLGLGLFLLLGIEFIKRPIRGLEGVRLATGMAPLVALPTLKTVQPKRSIWQRLLPKFRKSAKAES
jgi:polysaccharide biosynthesis transport protein